MKFIKSGHLRWLGQFKKMGQRMGVYSIHSGRRSYRTRLIFLSLLTLYMLLHFYNSCAPVDFNKVETLKWQSLERDISFPVIDILLVIDDSQSMKDNQAKLAEETESFLSYLEGLGDHLDWKLQVLTTRVCYYHGQPLPFYLGSSPLMEGGKTVDTLTSASRSLGSLGQIMRDTVLQIGAGKTLMDSSCPSMNGSDERGIASLYQHLKAHPEFYRPWAALATIVLSDEDERSTGGLGGKSIEDQDRPEVYISLVHEVLGVEKILNSHAIITPPGDTACSSKGTGSHFGTFYVDLAQRTKGIIGSICDPSYQNSLRAIAERIMESLAQIELACVPNRESLQLGVSPADMPIPSWSLDGEAEKTLILNPQIPPGHQLLLKYICADDVAKTPTPTPTPE